MKIFLISVGALAILSVSIGSLLVYQAYDRANANWQLFSDKQVEITVLMNELLQSMGYGGFIHHFKNAVLRHDLVHLEIASQRIKEAQDTIVKLKALNAFESPNDHWDILKTINAYQQKLDTAKLHITKGSEIDYIDFLVKVDDTEAFAALGRFENRITSQLKEQLAANLSDMETAKSLQSKVTVFVVILILIVFFLLYRYIRTNKTLLLRATESEKAKDRFLSNMSHEIRTPLNAIYGYLQLLQNNEQNVEKKENIKQAMTSAKYLTTILNDILDVAKVTSGEFTIEKTQFALSDVLESVKSELTILASKKSVTIDMVTKGLTHSQCKGDPVRLKQILLNVGSNAIKFSTKGTVTIEVSTHKLKPQLLCIKVVDSGIGMTDVGLSNLFKPFKQADNSTSRKFGGTGLGMAITLNIIKKMKGKIKVKSQVGKGTRIFIRLPLEKIAVKKKSTVKKLTSIPQLKGKSILVAEDNMVNMAIIKSMLSPTQASLTFAKNGQEACDIQNTKAFDMLLMDIQMPIMDGVTACKLIRGRTSDLPIIAVTANVMPHDVDEYLKAGFTNHIAKPIEQDKLNQLLSEYLLQDMAETPLGETKQ